MTLTRMQAEQAALKNNPRVSISQLLALAQHQVVREARAADLPTAAGAITAEKALDASRIPAGSLTASRVLTHAGGGGNFTQLITDFGRTHNLVFTQKLQEQVATTNSLATREEIVLAADQAFYDALTAQAVLQVANQTVIARQAAQTQVNQMTQNNLKSTLDLSFANVNLSQSQLLQLDAQNNADATMATLDTVLGLDHEVAYQLIDDAGTNPNPPPDFNPLIQTALTQRPDLQSLTFGQQSAQKFARAQRDQRLPSITAAGTLGTIPIRVDQYYTNNWWGGYWGKHEYPDFQRSSLWGRSERGEISSPGGCGAHSRSARSDCARCAHCVAAGEQRLPENWGNRRTTQQANTALQLAQTRYQLGLSSIVELSQAQLQQTSAAIDNTNAQYDYRLSLATLNYQIGTTP
jgi:outer membrane protein